MERWPIFENLQRSFICCLPGLKNFGHSDWLIINYLTSLKLKRLRMDCFLQHNVLHNNLYYLNKMFRLRTEVLHYNSATCGHNMKFLFRMLFVTLLNTIFFTELF